MIEDSSNNNIIYCNISNNPSGIVISDSSNNHIHHNNFISNDIHSLTEDLNTTSPNYWDDGSSEGNYWDDYTGTGDTPYVLSDSEQDGYPFTSPVENAGIAGFTRPLKAEFSYIPETPEINETIYFTDESSDPSGGTIVSWYWDFGDGNISTEQNPTHQYESEGYYTVNLTVTNDNSEEATTSEWLILYDESSENQKPTVTIISPESGATIEKGEVVTIEGTASNLEDLLLSVEVKIGGGNWAEADLTEGTWSYMWNTTGLPSGSQITIYAKASDLYGEYNETHVQVTIQSGGSGGTPGFEVAVLLVAVLLVSLFFYRKRR
jgi:parallel beta-helix repeat protein